MNEKVIVLLSSYNGEKYIYEQLNSIANQTGVDIKCVIRDDGSTDNTKSIIEQFAKSRNNFSYYFAKNIGCVNSFNKLMNLPEVASYKWIAFSDQDDIWLPDKLHTAITKIIQSKDYNDEKAFLYCSNLLVRNEVTKKTYLRRSYTPHPTPYKVIVQSYATGCTMVFNSKAVELYRKGIGMHMGWHDFWMFLVCSYFGRVIYDDEYHIIYRQHGNNQVGAQKKKILNTIKNVLKYNSGIRIKIITDFVNVYNSMLSNKQKEILSGITNYKNGMNRLFLAADWRYRGYEIGVTINFKLRVLLGMLY